MLRMKLIDHTVQLKNARLILQGRCALPHISSSSKYSLTSVRYKAKTEDKNDDDDNFDKPIKFSTSKAATFPAGYRYAATQEMPWYQGIVISLSLFIFCVYFFYLREENDIDENMVKNIPSEVLEQIYGKQQVKNNRK